MLPRPTGIPVAGWYEVVTRRAQGPFRLKHHFAFALALGVGLSAVNIFGGSALNGEQRVLAIAIVVLSALPAWLWLSGLDRGYPFMVFVGGLHALYYPIPLFFIAEFRVGPYNVPISGMRITSALWLLLAGVTSMLGGYYGPQRGLISAAMPKFRLRWSNPAALKFVGFTFAVAGFAFYLIAQSGAAPKVLGEAVGFAGDLVLIAICMLFGLQLIGALDLASKLVLWGVIVPARVILGAAPGLLAESLWPVFLILLFYAGLTHSMPWKTIFLGVMAGLILRATIMPYRLMLGERLQGASRLEKTVTLVGTVSSTVTAGRLSYREMAEFTLNHLCQVMTLAEVMRDTPDDVPYWGGATLYPVLLKPIPRLIWPDKPEEITGQSFGHCYGLLDPEDYGTSYNLPQLVELYINFGVAGALLGMFLYGIVYRAIVSLFVHPRMGFGALVAAAYVSMQWMTLEGAGLSFGRAFWGIVFIGLIHLVVEFAELMAAGPALGHSLGRSA